MAKRTKEPQYQVQLDNLEEQGSVLLGPTTSYLWRNDPRHLGFLLARYKFCAKILAGMSRVLEVGCGDGLGVRIVLQEVKSVHCIDFDPLFVDWAEKDASRERLNLKFSVLDITQEAPEGTYDAAYCLDLIEHIQPSLEPIFMENICKTLGVHAVSIIGTPNITAKVHASRLSSEGHINLKSAEMLKKLMSEYFHNVFMFSMNDEVVHIGFYPMAHYLLGVGVGLKGQSNFQKKELRS